MSGIDAHESDQTAMGWNGTTYDQGEIVKRMLCKKIGDKRVEVRIDDTDRYGRLLGTVFLDDEGTNRRMVRKGMWGYEVAYDPRRWKHGKRVPI